MGINKAFAVEKFMNCKGTFRTHAENGVEKVGAGAKMGDGAKKLHAVALFLKGIIGSGETLDGDFLCVNFKGLAHLGSEHDGSRDGDGRADVEP